MDTALKFSISTKIHLQKDNSDFLDYLITPVANVVWFFDFIKIYIYNKYKYKQFRKKFSYTQLTKIKEDLTIALDEICYCSECNKKHDNWYIRSVSKLYVQMLEMIERKRKQEEILLGNYIDGFTQLKKELSSKDLNVANQEKTITLLKNELQYH